MCLTPRPSSRSRLAIGQASPRTFTSTASSPGGGTKPGFIKQGDIHTGPEAKRVRFVRQTRSAHTGRAMPLEKLSPATSSVNVPGPWKMTGKSEFIGMAVADMRHSDRVQAARMPRRAARERPRRCAAEDGKKYAIRLDPTRFAPGGEGLRQHAHHPSHVLSRGFPS